MIKSFTHYLNTHRKNISEIISVLMETANNRIEKKDLHHEAVYKLLASYRGRKPLDLNYTKASIRNHLKDYIKKNGRANNMTDYIMDNYLNSNLE